MNGAERMIGHLSELYDHSETPVFFADQQLSIQWSNQKAKELFPAMDRKDGLFVLAPALEADKTLKLLKEHKTVRLDGVHVPLSRAVLTLEPLFYENELQGAAIFVERVSLPSQNSSVVGENDVVSLFSNQIRSPLSIIFSSLSAMSRLADLKNEDVYDPYLEEINQNCYRILKSCLYISEITRYLNGDNPPFLERVDLCKVVESQCKAIEMVTESLDIPFEYSVPDTPVYTLCDVKKLSLAIFNVTANSCKFTRPENRISLNLTVSGNKAILTVSDHGIGISPEDLPHIFTPYFLSQESSMVFGTGLGLSLVKQIISQQGGTVAVNSVPDKGTTVAFTLPIRDDDSYPISVSDHAIDYLNDKFSTLYISMADVLEMPMP